MPFEVEVQSEHVDLSRAGVFLSASIPDPERWQGAFDPLAITDAVVALVREVLDADGILITAAHPTIAPLVLYVARELQGPLRRPNIGWYPRVIVYQSRVYDSQMPTETRRFEEEGIGELRFTPAVEGDHPVPGEQQASLRLMRETLLDETRPSAMVVIGGMPGVAEEVSLYQERFPGQPIYAIGTPGGIASSLIDAAPADMAQLLTTDRVYPFVTRRIIEHLANHL